MIHAPTAAAANPVIGVFDSGFGGLTVLRALLPLLPGAHFIYLGDSARLPYGAKSAATVARFAIESALFLQAQGAAWIVIACNTATALALPQIRSAVVAPVIGVIEPGAQAALAAVEAAGAATTREVLVLATTATAQSHAYRAACESLGLRTTEMACPLLVPLIEEGWTDHAVTRDVLRIYLAEALAQCEPDVVLLGCTHYPLIAGPIEQVLRELGSAARVVDSAAATAEATRTALLNTTARLSAVQTPATFRCFATDSTEKFARLGSHFLGQTIEHVELLDLGG